MNSTTKAIWGAAALVAGTTIATGIILYDNMNCLQYYGKSRFKKDKDTRNMLKHSTKRDILKRNSR